MLEQFVSFVVSDAVSVMAYGRTILFSVFLSKIIFCRVIRILSMSKKKGRGGA